MHDRAAGARRLSRSPRGEHGGSLSPGRAVAEVVAVAAACTHPAATCARLASRGFADLSRRPEADPAILVTATAPRRTASGIARSTHRRDHRRRLRVPCVGLAVGPATRGRTAPGALQISAPSQAMVSTTCAAGRDTDPAISVTGCISSACLSRPGALWHIAVPVACANRHPDQPGAAGADATRAAETGNKRCVRRRRRHPRCNFREAWLCRDCPSFSTLRCKSRRPSPTR